jgi:hypothetical protein
MGQKRSDLDTLPLCSAHHEEQHRIGWPRFIQTYKLDVQGILIDLRERPRLEIVQQFVGKPLRTPMYLASYRQSEFLLCPASKGIKAAIQCAFRVCGEHLRDELIQRRVA